MAAKLQVTQVKSTISHIARNRATVRALGLHGIGSTSVDHRQPRDPRHGPPGPLPRHGRGDRRRARSADTGDGEGMKLHDLQPADGSRQPRTRVGRGIAAGKGKTAGRGTKGQKARAGGSIPPWFEGGQTPLHMRIPKLRGFKNRFKIEYEVVNVGAIGALAERGAFEAEDAARRAPRPAPITVNQDILRAVGLVRTLNKPLKILGAGELTVAAVRRRRRVHRVRARTKIEAAGGSVNVLEVPTDAARGAGRDTGPRPTADRAPAAEPRPPPTGRAVAKAPARRRHRTPAPPRPRRRGGEGRRAAKARPPRPPRSRADADEAAAADEADATEAAADEARRPTSRPRPTTPSRRRAPPRPRRPPATTPDPCSNRCSTPSARRTSGAGSSTSSALLIVFRLLAAVPVPGVDKDAARRRSSQGNALFGLLDLFSGGGLSNFSVVALGMNPYINASIIMQLMTGVVPSLQALSREGEYGRNKINQYTRYLTVPMAILQAYGFLALLNSQSVLTGDVRPGELRDADPDRDADRRRDRPDVDRRADHRARHRQRHQLHHLRRHREPRPERPRRVPASTRTSRWRSPSRSSPSPRSP